jgi:hypothetical protein
VKISKEYLTVVALASTGDGPAPPTPGAHAEPLVGLLGGTFAAPVMIVDGLQSSPPRAW